MGGIDSDGWTQATTGAVMGASPSGPFSFSRSLASSVLEMALVNAIRELLSSERDITLDELSRISKEILFTLLKLWLDPR